MAAAARVAQAAQRPTFDLPDAFARQPKLLADFFQCIRAAVFQPESEAQNSRLARAQGREPLALFIERGRMPARHRICGEDARDGGSHEDRCRVESAASRPRRTSSRVRAGSKSRLWNPVTS